LNLQSRLFIFFLFYFFILFSLFLFKEATMAIFNQVNEVLHRIRVKLRPNRLPNEEDASRADNEAAFAVNAGYVPLHPAAARAFDKAVADIGAFNPYLGKSDSGLGKSNLRLGKSDSGLGKSDSDLGKSNLRLGKSASDLGKSNTDLGKSDSDLEIFF
jgi:hypothetical protein